MPAVNVLVVFYSRYGETERLALAAGLGAIQAEGHIRLRRLADLAPRERIDADADWSRGLARMNRETLSQAREIYAAAIRANPEDHFLHEVQGNFLQVSGDLPGATQAWQRAAELMPHDFLPWFQLGVLHARQNQHAEAQRNFRIALQRRPGLVEGWVARSPRLRAIDRAVAEHGWRILMITRLVPLFPYNLQNYAYGLTPMPFWPYVAITWVCMLPATAAYTLAGGALSGGRDGRRAVTYLGAAAALLVLISLLPGWLGRRSRVVGDLFREKP